MHFVSVSCIFFLLSSCVRFVFAFEHDNDLTFYVYEDMGERDGMGGGSVELHRYMPSHFTILPDCNVLYFVLYTEYIFDTKSTSSGRIKEDTDSVMCVYLCVCVSTYQNILEHIGRQID